MSTEHGEAAPFASELGEAPPAEQVALADGRVVLVRPICPDDGPALREAIATADADTIQQRFFGARPPLDDATIRRLVEVDYRTRLALVAVDTEGSGVGIARYEGSPGCESAEVAIVVLPGWRRVGLGTQLLDLLGRAAIERGIRRFTAIYRAENEAVSRLLAKSGLPHRSTVTAGYRELEIDLPSA